MEKNTFKGVGKQYELIPCVNDGGGWINVILTIIENI